MLFVSHIIDEANKKMIQDFCETLRAGSAGC